MDVLQAAPPGLLHHGTHGLLIAFKIPLHGKKYLALGPDAVQLRSQGADALIQCIPPLLPSGLAQGVAGDHIVGSRFVLFCLAQRGTAGIQFLQLSLAAILSGLQFALELLSPLLADSSALFNAAQICLTARDIGSQVGLPAAQLQKMTGQPLGTGGHFRLLPLQVLQSRVLFAQQLPDGFDSFLCLGHLRGDTAAALILPTQFFFDPPDIGMIVGNVAAQHSHLAIQLLMGGFQHIRLDPGVFQGVVPAVQFLAERLGLRVQFLQLLVGLLQHKVCGVEILLGLLSGGGQLVKGVQPYGHLHLFQLFLIIQIFDSLFRLLLQRLQLDLQLGDLVADAQQVVLRVGKLALRFLLAVAILGNARRLLKDLPAVAALDGQYLVDLVNTALSDIGIALPAKAGVHEQLMDVTQSGGLAVDVIFAVAGTVVPAGDHHLVGIVSQGAVGIVQGQGSLGKAHGSTLQCTAKNHVLHLSAPQGLGTLLAHDPQNGIGDI